MTKIYIVRHCEAQGNAKRLFQGTSDFDISELGAIQLEFLKKRFKDISLDAVYSSPLIRAYKTAVAIAEEKGLKVIKKDNLKELHGGIVEGKPFAESFEKYPLLADAWDNHPQDFAPEGGEPMREGYERIWDAILEIVKENKGKSVAVAAHGGVIRCLMSRLMFGTVEKLKDVPWGENTAVTLIEFNDDGVPYIHFFNDFSHVPEEYLPKRNRLSSLIGIKK